MYISHAIIVDLFMMTFWKSEITIYVTFSGKTDRVFVI